MSAEAIIYLVLGIVGGLVTLVGFIRSTLKERREAIAKAEQERQAQLLAARHEGFDSRNDEVSLLRARLEDRDRDVADRDRQISRLEDRVDALTNRMNDRPRPGGG